MIRRLCLSIALAAVLVLLIAVPVLAGYYSYLLTENTGTSYTKLALNLTMDIAYMVSQGYISPSGLDTRVTDAQYNCLPHMLADDKVLWVSDLEGNSTTQFIFFTKQTPISSFPTITGHGGWVTLADDATFEPGDMFAFGISGYIDTAAGTGKNIIRKDGALCFNVTADEELTFKITGGSNITASNVTADYHTIMIYQDGYSLWMDIDDVTVGNVTASAVPNTANNWTFFENDVMPYISYYGQWVVP